MPHEPQPRHLTVGASLALVLASILALVPTRPGQAEPAAPGPTAPVPRPASAPVPTLAAPVVPGVAAPLPVTAATPSVVPPPAAPPAVAPPYGPLETAATLVEHPERMPMQSIATVGHRLVAGGRAGVLVLSDDNGASWRQVPLPASSTITDIRFADDQTGWAVGHDGIVLRTGDAGAHWALVYDGMQAAQAALDAARSGNLSDSARHDAIAAAQSLVRQDPGRPFQLIQLSGPDHVRLIGADGLSVTSTDGGRSWQPWAAAIDNPKRLQAYGLAERRGIVLVAGAQGLLLAGRPENGLQPIRPPCDGSLFGVLDGGRQGFVIFGQHGHAFASGDLAADWTPSTDIGWHRIDDPSPTSLTAGLLRHDGSVLLADASGATWMLQGRPDNATLVPAPAQAPFPILAMAEAPDHGLILLGKGGILRIAP